MGMMITRFHAECKRRPEGKGKFSAKERLGIGFAPMMRNYDAGNGDKRRFRYARIGFDLRSKAAIRAPRPVTRTNPLKADVINLDEKQSHIPTLGHNYPEKVKGKPLINIPFSSVFRG